MELCVHARQEKVATGGPPAHGSTMTSYIQGSFVNRKCTRQVAEGKRPIISHLIMNRVSAV
jgi:hypothetical protein